MRNWFRDKEEDEEREERELVMDEADIPTGFHEVRKEIKTKRQEVAMASSARIR